ncbi:MAG: DUF4249 domain-containing protein [Chitinophagaceae bacterium]|nr:MAG: DUF4249 domain-containing protein [Chitinophagaceae bacterium]
MKFVIGCLLILLTFTGCEKDINFDLDEVEPVLVVDAQIENEQAPVVILTKSFSYFDNLNPDLLANSFVRNAEVYISNGILTHRLKEYPAELVPGINGWYYSIDSSNLATAFTGALGGDYTLRIVTEGAEYTSATQIPTASNFPDSVWFKRAPQNPDTLKRVMYVTATDPPGRGNYYRYFTKIGNGPFYPGQNVFNDQVLEGSTYTIIFPPGINRNRPVRTEENFFLKGEKVTLKFSGINAATYNFWNTWEFAYQSIGNPFAQPNKVLGNISNGGLGAFCGYAAGYQTYIVP